MILSNYRLVIAEVNYCPNTTSEEFFVFVNDVLVNINFLNLKIYET